jgi:hypothetical protein
MRIEISSLRKSSCRETSDTNPDVADQSSNIMISDDDEPILMDFGSTIKSAASHSISG